MLDRVVIAGDYLSVKHDGEVGVVGQLVHRQVNEEVEVVQLCDLVENSGVLQVHYQGGLIERRVRVVDRRGLARGSRRHCLAHGDLPLIDRVHSHVALIRDNCGPRHRNDDLRPS